MLKADLQVIFEPFHWLCITVFTVLKGRPEPEELGAAKRPKPDDHRVELTVTAEAIENLLRQPPFPPSAPL
jgi:hypothetical protein